MIQQRESYPMMMLCIAILSTGLAVLVSVGLLIAHFWK